MSPAAWLLLAMLPSAPDVACPRWDALLGGGSVVHARSAGDGWGFAPMVTGGAGAELDGCLGLPLRTELDLLWDGRGAPWGQGVEAVEVARLSLELSALAGVRWQWLGDARLGLGVDALLGASLRWVRVHTRVLRDEQTAHDLLPRLTMAAGLNGHWGRLQLALRARTGLPWDDGVGLLLIVGFRL